MQTTVRHEAELESDPLWHVCMLCTPVTDLRQLRFAAENMPHSIKHNQAQHYVNLSVHVYQAYIMIAIGCQAQEV